MALYLLYKDQIKQRVRKARFRYKLRGINGTAMRLIESDDELRRLASASAGFIHNDLSGAGSNGEESNMLHAASCHTLDTANVNTPKYFAQNAQNAVIWLEAHRGIEGIGWRRCTICNPRQTTNGADSNVAGEIVNAVP